MSTTPSCNSAMESSGSFGSARTVRMRPISSGVSLRSPFARTFCVRVLVCVRTCARHPRPREAGETHPAEVHAVHSTFALLRHETVFDELSPCSNHTLVSWVARNGRTLAMWKFTQRINTLRAVFFLKHFPSYAVRIRACMTKRNI